MVCLVACTHMTPLQKTAYKGDVRAIKGLIQEGSSVNEKSKDGKTPLMYAAMGGHVDVAEALISVGAVLDDTDSLGMTAIHYAAYYGSQNVASKLIEKGATVNIVDKSDFTPLDYSVKDYYYPNIANLLIKAGAQFGNRILAMAIVNLNEEALPLILSQDINVNEKDNEGMTALHRLAHCTRCQQNKGVIAEKILQKGADTSIKDKYGYTALRYAFYYNAIDVAAAIRRYPMGQKEAIYDLSFDEALKVPLQKFPNIENYDVTKDKEKVFQIAALDCNFLIMSGNKKLLLLVGGPLAYGASLAFDKVQYEPKFQSCMEKMGFKCVNNCKK